MKKLNNLKSVFVCVLMVVFAACGSDDDNTLDAKLCKTWTEEYVENSTTYTHQLIFATNHSGQEVKRTYVSGTANTTTRDFTWQWMDNSQEGLILNYGAGDIGYLENVWVREHYLTGKLNGELIMMVDNNYRK